MRKIIAIICIFFVSISLFAVEQEVITVKVADSFGNPSQRTVDAFCAKLESITKNMNMKGFELVQIEHIYTDTPFHIAVLIFNKAKDE